MVTAIDHVGIAVADLDAAIDFYTSTFGLQVTHIEVNHEQGVREAMLSVAGEAASAEAATAIQLLAPLDKDSVIGKFLNTKGPGLQQLAYRVSDVDAAVEELTAKGLRVLYRQAKPGTAGSKVNFIHPKDTGGVLIELVQPPVTLP